MINSAQYLRAVAAIVVLLFHASVGATNAFGGSLDSLFRFGVAGVDVFFVLSGFIMYISLSRPEGPDRPLDFMLKRTLRIVPLYWLATLCLAALYWQKLLPAIPENPLYYIGSFLFIPQAVPGHPGEFYPLLSVGWTLNYEMFFYALISISILLGGKAFPKVLLGLTLTLFLAGRILQPEAAIPFTYTSPLILEFAGGVVIGMAFLRGIRISPIAGGVATAAAVIVIVCATSMALGPQMLRLAVWGVPAMVLVAGATLVRNVAADSRGILLLGSASYAIYLFHPIVITALQMAWLRLFGAQDSPVGAILFILVAMLLGCGIGVGIHLFIEKPATLYLRRRLNAAAATRRSRPATG